MANAPRKQVKHFVIDVDGVLTDGRIYYTPEGKFFKVFGPDDSDALFLLRKHINVVTISGDKKGFPITQKRVEMDMKLPLFQVSTFERVAWIEEKFGLEETIYMGDGIFDAMVFDKVGYSIAPANAFFKTKERANFVTSRRGGDGAVAEACWHIMEKFFEPWDELDMKLSEGQGEWGKQA